MKKLIVALIALFPALAFAEPIRLRGSLDVKQRSLVEDAAMFRLRNMAGTIVFEIDDTGAVTIGSITVPSGTFDTVITDVIREKTAGGNEFVFQDAASTAFLSFTFASPLTTIAPTGALVINAPTTFEARASTDAFLEADNGSGNAAMHVTATGANGNAFVAVAEDGDSSSVTITANDTLGVVGSVTVADDEINVQIGGVDKFTVVTTGARVPDILFTDDIRAFTANGSIAIVSTETGGTGVRLEANPGAGGSLLQVTSTGASGNAQVNVLEDGDGSSLSISANGTGGETSSVTVQGPNGDGIRHDTWLGGFHVFSENNVEKARLAEDRWLVGTSSPIFQSGGTVAPLIQSAYTTAEAGFVAAEFSADAVAPRFMFLKSRGVTIGAHAAVVDEDILGTHAWEGSDGTAYQRTADILGIADGTISAGDVPGRLDFRTQPEGVGNPLATRLRIHAIGNILAGDVATIGTAAGAFHIAGIADDQTLIVQGFAGQTAPLQEWQNSAGTFQSLIEADGTLRFAANAQEITVDDGTLNVGSNISLSGFFQSTVATGTAPLVIASTTTVANLSSEFANGVKEIPGSVAADEFGATGGLTVEVGGTTVTVTGATTGDPCSIGIPSGATMDSTYFCKVTASNTATLYRSCANGETAGVANACANDGSLTWKVTIHH
jgi:hypothetical protein